MSKDDDRCPVCGGLIYHSPYCPFAPPEEAPAMSMGPDEEE